MKKSKAKGQPIIGCPYYVNYDLDELLFALRSKALRNSLCNNKFAVCFRRASVLAWI
jgi:hypothetical protein